MRSAIVFRAVSLALIMAVLAGGVAVSQQKDKKKDKDKPAKDKGKDKGKDKCKSGKADCIAGAARWDWTLSDGKGKEIETGVFLAKTDGEILHLSKPIGKWKSLSANTVQVDFSAGKLKGFSGEVKRRGKEKPTFAGEVTDKEGTKNKLVIEIRKD